VSVKTKKKTILCTGSGGFILSNFIRRAIYHKLDYNFISIDRVKKKKAIDNVYTNKNHKFYIGDVTDPHFINVIFEIERPDIVIHGAAETNKASDTIVYPNVIGTNIIANACLKWGVERLIYISDIGVYGSLETESEPIWTEQSPLNPKNTYAASKASGELLIMASGVDHNIVRLGNTFGPRQDVEKFIPTVIKHVLNNEKVPIYAHGTSIRDWMHVFDTCSAIISILNGPSNETYNISCNELSSVEIFQLVCNTMNKGHDLAHFVDGPKQDFRRSASIKKLTDTLGWKQEYKVKDGIIICVEWFLQNQWFLNKK
jgi:dTDP-glucose 4,6-dehydratase